jgi:phage shock protein C
MKPFERSRKNRLYRSGNGVLLGVCKGLADYFDFSVYWVRAILIICLILSGFWPIMGLYFLAALIMKPEPAIPVMSEAEKGSGAIERLIRRHEKIEHRLRRMEDTVTTKEYDWDRRLNT